MATSENLDKFINILSKNNILDLKLSQNNIENEEFIDNIKLIFTFFQLDYKEAVWHKIKSLGKNERENVLINLMKLYPFSQNIVLELLRKREQYDDMFVRGVDFNECVYKCLKEKLNDMRRAFGEGRLTKRFEDYEADIKDLGKKIEELQSNISKNHEYYEKKQHLEAELKDLEKEFQKEEQETCLAKLEKEINEIKNKKTIYEKEIKEKKDKLKKIKEELELEKDKFEDKDMNMHLRELLKKFPADEGGDIV